MPPPAGARSSRCSRPGVAVEVLQHHARVPPAGPRQPDRRSGPGRRRPARACPLLAVRASVMARHSWGRRTGADDAHPRASGGRAPAGRRSGAAGTATLQASPLLAYLLAGLPSATLGAGAARVWSNVTGETRRAQPSPLCRNTTHRATSSTAPQARRRRLGLAPPFTARPDTGSSCRACRARPLRRRGIPHHGGPGLSARAWGGRVVPDDEASATGPGEVAPGQVDQGGDAVAVAEQGDQVQGEPREPGNGAADSQAAG